MAMNKLDSSVQKNAPRAAADWRARLESGQTTEETWVQFTAWMEEHPGNRAAFDDLDAASAEVDHHRAELLQAEADQPVRSIARLIPFPMWARVVAASALAASVLVAFILT